MEFSVTGIYRLKSCYGNELNFRVKEGNLGRVQKCMPATLRSV